MKEELVSLSVSSSYDHIHFVCDTSESLVKSKITFHNETYKEKYIHDIRVLIYELFSNAINHSTGSIIHIVYKIGDDSLTIEIETSGAGFTIKPVDEKQGIKYVPPYNEEIINKKFNVYKDSENLIYCHVLSDMNLDFRLNKVDAAKDKEEIPEHYGLYLITCLSDLVRYKRAADGRDIFTIKKNINQENDKEAKLKEEVS